MPGLLLAKNPQIKNLIQDTFEPVDNIEHLFGFVKRHFLIHMDPPPDAQSKLNQEKNIWIATVMPDGRPHLVPIWFVWQDQKIYLSIDPASVKARNIAQNSQVVLALEDGSHPVICQGEAYPVPQPLPVDVIKGFSSKYDWDITIEKQYNQLVVVHPKKWLVW